MAKKREQVDPERIRRSLLYLAETIRLMDEQGQLLESSPELIRLMGNLRAQLFEYEVRCTGRLLPDEKLPPEVVEAQRIVEEAARKLEDEEDEEWWRRFSSEADEETG